MYKFNIFIKVCNMCTVQYILFIEKSMSAQNTNLVKIFHVLPALSEHYYY